MGYVGPSVGAWRRLLLASFCAVALISGGDGIAAVPSPLLHPHERVSSQARPSPLPESLSEVLDQPRSVPGGYAMALTADVGAHRVHASWTYVDGVPALNSHVDSWLLGRLDEALPGGGRYRPAMALNAGQAQGREITLSAEPVQANGAMVVVRERATTAGPDGTVSIKSSTVYVDTASGTVRNGSELLRPDAIPAIQARIAGIPAALVASVPNDAPTDIVLNPAGELTITAFLSGTSGRLVTITMNAGDTQDALSDYGRQALGQLNGATPARPASASAFRHVNCDLVPCAALTYDDGPDARTTPQLLDILREKDAQGTFFMTGSNTAAHPATAKQVADAGYAIGNHTFSHSNLTKLSPPEVRKDIGRTDAAILAATGSTPTLMRPPYGAADAAVQAAVGKPLMIWAVDSLDWQSKSPAAFVPKVLKEITPGAMVLMHDVQPTTIAGQRELIAGLQGQGYRLVSVPQLFDGIPLAPGRVYRSRPARQ